MSIGENYICKFAMATINEMCRLLVPLPRIKFIPDSFT